MDTNEKVIKNKVNKKIVGVAGVLSIIVIAVLIAVIMKPSKTEPNEERVLETPTMKKELTDVEKINQIEVFFRLDLSNDVQLKKYEFNAEGTYSYFSGASGYNMLAELELDESEYENILKQCQEDMYDMFEYAGEYKENVKGIWNDEIGIRDNSPKIEYWYQVESEHKPGDYLIDSDGLFMNIEYTYGHNVLITEVKNGKFSVFVAANLDVVNYY